MENNENKSLNKTVLSGSFIVMTYVVFSNEALKKELC